MAAVSNTQELLEGNGDMCEEEVKMKDTGQQNWP